ncbi:MAG: LptF/LptG family permease [Kiritimatiellia bacterium]|nr:LptF/LptG family permease [Kiritimatiellia bacterium]
MRVLTGYVVRDYLITFAMTVGVLTFVMTLGSVVRAIDLLARGVSGGLMLQFLALSIPFMLQFTVPMATLTAALLMFTRLSLDGEITAMKACGLSLWGIVSPVLITSLVLSGVSLWLSNDLSPRCKFAQRNLLARLGETDPLALIEEGQFIRDFPGYMIYVGKRLDNEVEDIVIYEVGELGMTASIRARKGILSVDSVSRKMRVDLYDARIDQMDPSAPNDPTRSRSFSARHYPREMDFGDLFRSGRRNKKISDKTSVEMMQSLRDQGSGLADSEAFQRERTAIAVECSTRVALGLGCFGFTLLGIPLGMRSKRKESYVGYGISILIMFAFYFCMILAKSAIAHPEWVPELMVWIPLWIAEILGLFMIHRMN